MYLYSPQCTVHSISSAFVQFSHGSSSVEDIEIGKFNTCCSFKLRITRLRCLSCLFLCGSEVPRLTQDGSTMAVPAPVQVPVAVHPPLNETVVDELPPNNSTPSVTPSEPPGFESVPTSAALPVPTFVNGCRASKPCPMPQTSQDFDSDIIGDDFDDLLDQPESSMVSEFIHL